MNESNGLHCGSTVGRLQGRAPTHSVQILSFSCSFRKKIGQIMVGASTFGVRAPHLGRPGSDTGLKLTVMMYHEVFFTLSERKSEGVKLTHEGNIYLIVCEALFSFANQIKNLFFSSFFFGFDKRASFISLVYDTLCSRLFNIFTYVINFRFHLVRRFYCSSIFSRAVLQLCSLNGFFFWWNLTISPSRDEIWWNEAIWLAGRWGHMTNGCQNEISFLVVHIFKSFRGSHF